MKLFAVALVLRLGIGCSNPPHRSTSAPATSPASTATACERAWNSPSVSVCDAEVGADMVDTMRRCVSSAV